MNEHVLCTKFTFRFWAIDLKMKPRVLYKMSRIARANVGRGLAGKAFLRYFAAVKSQKNPSINPLQIPC